MSGESNPYLIKVAHSPDPDDAFMFYALAKHCVDTGKFVFTHKLVDIETLNQLAHTGYYELTALSVHAYAYLSDTYMLCPCGASIGDNYGPMIVAKESFSKKELRKLTIAVPGTMTTAFLAAGMYMEGPFDYVVVPFDRILDYVQAGKVLDGPEKGREVAAGLIIHEGQLTYMNQRLKLIVDTGVWWMQQTGFPLPLGANGIRKNMGSENIRDVNRILKESIQYGLDHRKPAIEYALQFGRGLDLNLADKFVGMYVNDWTLDFGPRGRESVRLLLERGFNAGLIPKRIEPEFVS